eukprot:2003280-Pleurochrysis_carterae.AAC.1
MCVYVSAVVSIVMSLGEVAGVCVCQVDGVDAGGGSVVLGMGVGGDVCVGAAKSVGEGMGLV